MNQSKIVIGYARVSSREQAIDSNALTQQIERLKDAGAEQVFFDVESGTKDARPGLMKLVTLARQGVVSKLICTRLDRLGRSRKTTYDLVCDLFEQHQIEIDFLDDPAIRLNNVGGGLVLAIMAEFAKMETDRLKERVKHGIEYRRKQGWAPPCAPWGYIVVGHKYQLDHRPFLCLLEERPINYQQLSQIDETTWQSNPELLAGYTKSQVCRDVINTFLRLRRVRPTQKYMAQRYGFTSSPVHPHQSKGSNRGGEKSWSNTGLKLWLVNPVLQGHTVYGRTTGSGGKVKIPESEWQFLRNTHPEQRLISDAEADEIRNIFRLIGATRGNAAGPKSMATPLTGLIFCAVCKTKAILKTVNRKTHRYYGCRNTGIGCSCKGNTNVQLIEQRLVDEIVRRAQEISSSPDEDSSLRLTSTLIEELQPQLDALNTIQEIHLKPTLLQVKNSLEQQIRDELDRMKKVDIRDAVGEVIIRHSVAADVNFWFTLTLAEREVIYPRLLDRLEIKDRDVVLIRLKV